MFRKEFWLSLAVILVFSAAAFSQGTTGQISGVVTDSSGAVVPSASVKVTNTATNLERQTTTSGEGIYSFQLLPPGEYKVEVSAGGFAIRSFNVTVNITQTTNADAELGVGNLDENMVTINAGASQIQTETAQAGRVVTRNTSPTPASDP